MTPDAMAGRKRAASGPKKHVGGQHGSSADPTQVPVAVVDGQVVHEGRTCPFAAALAAVRLPRSVACAAL
eukprot:564475-Alexandrium_andersonii.AAC.1